MRNWIVTGVFRALNLREQPCVTARIVAIYAPGTILDNLGCQSAERRIWCDVQQSGGGPRSYVATEFLKPAISPDGNVATGPDNPALRASQGDFDATGKIPCAQYLGQPHDAMRLRYRSCRRQIKTPEANIRVHLLMIWPVHLKWTCWRYHYRQIETGSKIELVDLQSLAKSSDVVTLQVRLTNHTRQMIGQDEFVLMKKDAFLIETSRGAVLNETALVEALKNKKIWRGRIRRF